MIPPEASLLRVYSKAIEKWHGVPLYRAIVEEARRRHLAGASVFPVELGYGSHRQLHDMASEYAFFDIPVVVEIVDAAERVAGLVAELETMVSEGLLTVSPASVHLYTHGSERGTTAPQDIERFSQIHTRQVSGAGGTISMKIEGEGKRVTVYVGSADTWSGRNLAIAIVEQCRKLGLAGATVSRGVMGFGKHSVIHKAHLLALSDDLPEKIEVVDRPEEIERLLPVLDQMIGGGLIVVEDVHVVRYLHEPKGEKGTVS
jgi:PII-like signaling protein